MTKFTIRNRMYHSPYGTLRVLTFIVSFLFISQSFGQVFTVPSSGSDTANTCFGLLRDPGGTSNYPSYSNGYFVIDPPGNGSVSVLFSQFNTYNYSDYVTLYDGVGTSGTILGSYYGGSLPNGGSAISSTSGAVTVRFNSNCCSETVGFTMSWTSSSSSTPTAQFAVNTSPAYNTPVQFINTTINGGTYLWEFGDGSTSTDANPQHSYTTSGPQQARLIATNCAGSDTSAYTTINVQSAPVGSVSSDTVTMTVACGSTNSGSFTISNSGSGILNYNLALSQNAANTIFEEDFEGSGLGSFTNLNSNNTTTTVRNTGAPQGTQYMEMGGYGFINDGLSGSFSSSTPEYISYRVKDDTYASYHGYVNFGNLNSFGNMEYMFYSVMRYNTLRLYYRDIQNNYTTYYNATTTLGNWSRVELKNIDFTSQTFDIYLDGSLVVSGAGFVNTSVTSINEVRVYNSSTATIGIDDFQILGDDLLNKVLFNPKTGNLTNGSNSVIFINANAAGLNAGTYWLNFTISSNDTALDGKSIPLKLIVTGTPTLGQSVNCLNYGTVFTGYPYQDSVMLSNSGCDTLDFSSITTSNSDITTSNSSLTLAPGDTTKLYVTLTPGSITTFADTVYLNGPDTNSVICISAQSTGAPQLSVDTTALSATVVGCDDSVLVQKTIYNPGLGTLNYSTVGAGQMDLQDVLDAFRTNFGDVTALIPSIYYFSEGTTGNGIGDGGFDMYDGGNYLYTDLSSLYMNYSDDLVIANPTSLGTGGQYFTYKGTGIWLFAADINGVADFNITGNLGADGSGSADGAVLTTNVNGIDYKGFVKRVYSAGDPSVNHLVIVEDKGTASHTFSTNTNSDFHSISGLSGHTRIYHLLYASTSGGYINNTSTQSIMEKFLEIAHGNTMADFVTVSPDSGQVAAGDSVVLNMWVKSTGLDAGTYSTVIGVNSNDPNNPAAMFELNLTVVGTPEIVLPTACVNFGSVMNGAVVTDTIDVFNSGCDTLDLTGYTATNSDISASIVTSFVAPGDTGRVAITFAPTFIASYTDTVFITNNDTLSGVCITGTGIAAPSATLTPDSIYASFASCNDSITIPLKLKNSGLGQLLYDLEGSGNDNPTVVLYQYIAYGNEYTKVKNIINQIPNVTIIETNTFGSAALASDLANADVLIIPEGSNVSTTVVATIQNFVSNGGTYIQLLTGSNYSRIGILPISYTSTFSSSNAINNMQPSHPIMSGLPSSFSWFSATNEAIMSTGASYEILAQRSFGSSNSGVVVTTQYGDGHGVYIGYDYFSSNSTTEDLLRQAVLWGGNNRIPEFISVVPDSGAVASNDSVTLNVTIRSATLTNGRHTATLKISTNDPLNPEIEVPVVVDVNGQGEILPPANCMDFDSLLVGATATDSTWITNVGCDTLNINSSASSSGDFSLSGTPYMLLPGDSAMIVIDYTPSSIGVVNDTLMLYGTSDTAGVCVSGKGLGAPVGVVNPDTLVVDVNKCDGLATRSFTIQNTGQGSMDYVVHLGEQYVDTSRAFFSTSGASTTHIFGNTPSTADTIWFMVVVNGDYDGTGEDYTVNVEGNAVTSGYQTNNLTIGINDTNWFFYTGPNISTWLADNTLNVTIQNTSSVNNGFTNALDMHFVEVRMGGAAPPWMSLLSSSTGSVSVSGTVTKNLVFDPSALTTGSYTTIIYVASNDPVNPFIAMPVEFNVKNEPSIDVSDSCLIFPTTLVGDTTIQDMWIYNRGCTNLSVGSILAANGSFRVSPANGSVGAGDSLKVSVSYIPTAITTVNSNIIINNNDSTVIVCLNAASNSKPVAAFSVSVENACDGVMRFEDVSQFNPLGYYWTFGDGLTGTNKVELHTYNKPGTYKVTLRSTNAAGWDTTSQMVTVNPFLVNFDMSASSVKVNTAVNFYDSTVTANTWTWDFGDGNSSTSANPTHTYTAVGTYTVMLTAEDNRSCNKSITKTIKVYDDIGINEFTVDGKFYSLFPNPTEGSVTIEASDLDWTAYELTIYDAAGRAIQKINPQGYERITLDLVNVEAGMYQLVITKDGAMKSRKSIIRQ